MVMCDMVVTNGQSNHARATAVLAQVRRVLRVTCYLLRVTCYVLRVTCYLSTCIIDPYASPNSDLHRTFGKFGPHILVGTISSQSFWLLRRNATTLLCLVSAMTTIELNDMRGFAWFRLPRQSAMYT